MMMMGNIRAVILVCAGLAAWPAWAGVVACPATAENPLASGHFEGLAQVEVWSAPLAGAIDLAAPPSLIPDDQTDQADSWTLDRDPGWRDFLVCDYGTHGHRIMFDVTGLAQCRVTGLPTQHEAATCH